FHYFTYCTWSGRILFGEDLYVRPEFRGRGPSARHKTALSSQMALANGCSHFRFMSPKRNEPAMALYEKLGAVDVTKRDSWDVWHIEGQAVQEIAARPTE
uniref:N-acetyltransferase domain-containing protein n=1 Tax=Pelusios castaneus TaxID=367368 RepID=A0A8C8RI86_9SAUR